MPTVNGKKPCRCPGLGLGTQNPSRAVWTKPELQQIGPLRLECYFSRAAAANDHKLGDFKQYKCILSQFWRLQV